MGAPPFSVSPVAALTDPLGLVGTILDGQFKVEEVVGLGTLSVVYRGRHEGVDAPIAIKVLNLPLTVDLEKVETMIRALRDTAKVEYPLGRKHPHIVQSLACGMTLAPKTRVTVPYLVREWLEGRALSLELTTKRGATSRRRSIREVTALLDSAADALALAHAEGIAHLDVRPSNLFVAWTNDGPLVKVLDFGASAMPREVTTYSAPEQRGEGGAVGPAADVYAFARIVCEALAGEPVMSPVGLPLSTDVMDVLTRALAPEPDARFPEMRAFWSELVRAAGASKSIAPPAMISTAAMKAVKPKKPPVPMRASPPPAPPSYDRASVTAEVAPAVVPPSVPAMPAASDSSVLVAVELSDFSDDEIGHRNADEGRSSILPAGMNPGQIARIARVAQSPKQQRILAIGGTVALAGIVMLLAFTAPRAEGDVGHEARVTASPAMKTIDTSKVARAPGLMALPADVVPSPPPSPAAVSKPGPPGRFSAPAARIALSEASVDLASCANASGPRGPGSVRVRFNPSGKMAEAYLGPPYAGTATGRCILERFSKVRVAKFVGVPASVNYAFYTIPF